MAHHICPYCDRIMERDPLAPLGVTRDHIMPQEWGGTNDADNLKTCCKQCNELRGMTGHCIGAMACLRTVAPRRKDWERLVRIWRLPRPIPPNELLRYHNDMKNKERILFEKAFNDISTRPVRVRCA
jgi:hypothetical protein